MRHAFGASVAGALAALGGSVWMLFRAAGAPPPMSLTPVSVPLADLQAVSRPLRSGASGWTVIEFMDYECPPCQMVGQAIDKGEIVPAEVGMRIAPFPLSFHKGAFRLSVAAEIAAEQGRFPETHRFFLNGGAPKTEPKSEPAARKVRRAMAVGKLAGVDATPTFLLAHASGRVYKVSGGFDLARALEAAQRQLKGG